ncbi:NUDIX domain-containing protein [Natrarchaeobius chitinivorans]|uniref:Initiation factor 2B n=1 Tax=Natrarchaeobius chitinivorans TaxID=1679083 RepID=A0A3N6MPQ1_NATCH|nr:NUDIX domain-containing protein [Natrarchaeobius chitinivorans]RQG96506.1 initiation factor 2B [Natrarchaeobius chitinivorans]
MNDLAGEDGDDGPTHVVTAFLRNDGDVLLMRRSDAVGTYAGRWGGVSGYAEGDPDEQVRVEIAEETGLEDDVSFVRSGRPVSVEDPALEREWVVHPSLFDCTSRAVELSEEHDAFEWIQPTEMLVDDLGSGDHGGDRETVPRLWTAYERVAPTVRSIAADDDHGAASLSIRALEVLRDRAGLLVSERTTDDANPTNANRSDANPTNVDPAGEWEELAALAARLLEARPSMAVLRNRVSRAMAEADEADGRDEQGAPAVLASTVDGIDRALAADADAAANAADRVDGRIATLSRSGTVSAAIRKGTPSRLFVAESRPAREGVDVAEELASDPAVDASVTVHTDAAAAHVLADEEIDRVVVGADTVLPDGSVVNKTGTRTLAVAAAREGVPVTAVAATDKVSTREGVNLESGDQTAVYDGDAAIDVLNPTFDVTPADCVEEVVTEDGRLEPAAIRAVAETLERLESWRDGESTGGEP